MIPHQKKISTKKAFENQLPIYVMLLVLLMDYWQVVLILVVVFNKKMGSI